MAKKNLMIMWTFGPLGKNLRVVNADGELPKIKISSTTGQQEFLALLDEYASSGWELVDTSTFGSPTNYTIWAYLINRG